MSLYNPRFPYTLVVERAVVDEYGSPAFDANGDPTYEVVEIEKVVYTDEECYNPAFTDTGEFLTETVTELNYGYRTSTGGLREAGEVIVADQKIAIPKVVSGINTGDILILTDNVRTYRGQVLKMMSYNWGANIWFNDVKN